MPSYLVIRRDSEKDIKMRALDVFLGDDLLADLPYGRSLRRKIEPGHHVLKASNRLYVKRLELFVDEGETVEIQVANIAGVLGNALLMATGVAIYNVRIEEKARGWKIKP
jgi:hypothetical protein